MTLNEIGEYAFFIVLFLLVIVSLTMIFIMLIDNKVERKIDQLTGRVKREKSSPKKTVEIFQEKKKEDEDFITSAGVAMATDSLATGLAIGGSVMGAVVGSSFANDDNDDSSYD